LGSVRCVPIQMRAAGDGFRSVSGCRGKSIRAFGRTATRGVYVCDSVRVSERYRPIPKRACRDPAVGACSLEAPPRNRTLTLWIAFSSLLYPACRYDTNMHPFSVERSNALSIWAIKGGRAGPVTRGWCVGALPLLIGLFLFGEGDDARGEVCDDAGCSRRAPGVKELGARGGAGPGCAFLDHVGGIGGYASYTGRRPRSLQRQYEYAHVWTAGLDAGGARGAAGPG
jgi:hypothetical protein